MIISSGLDGLNVDNSEIQQNFALRSNATQRMKESPLRIRT